MAARGKLTTRPCPLTPHPWAARSQGDGAGTPQAEGVAQKLLSPPQHRARPPPRGWEQLRTLQSAHPELKARGGSGNQEHRAIVALVNVQTAPGKPLLCLPNKGGPSSSLAASPPFCCLVKVSRGWRGNGSAAGFHSPRMSHVLPNHPWETPGCLGGSCSGVLQNLLQDKQPTWGPVLLPLRGQSSGERAKTIYYT